ncbi:MAG: O-antigen ligase family protein [Microbacterium sp.]|jgi:hypothetical protein|nr:O-antigen ligase family protein [Microbacterium sp.]
MTGGFGGVGARLRARVPEWWAGAWRWALFAVGLVIAVYLFLDRGISGGVIAAAAIACLVIGAALTRAEPMAIALMATPALFIVERVGLGVGDLTVSDVALAAAFGTAILLGRNDFSPPMRAMLWLNLIYQFASLMTVIVNPFTQNTVEWVHAWLLVSGALIAGWGIGRAGKARVAFILIHAMVVVIAIGTIFTAIGYWQQGDLLKAVYPEWPWMMHKNFAGGMLAFGAFLAYVNPDWARLDRRWTRFAFWFFLVALGLTQSRQAAIGLVVALLIFTLRQGAAKHVLMVIVLVVPGIILIILSVRDQIESQNRFNSVYQRLDWIREVYALWKHSPIFGHGLRYWYVTPGTNFQPPQAELEVLASTGIVGLLGFIIMWVGFLVVLWRMHPQFGLLALGMVLSRIVQAQFDLFWVASQVSVPFFIAGICLGAQALAHERDPDTGFWAPEKVRVRRAEGRIEQRRRARLPGQREGAHV